MGNRGWYPNKYADDILAELAQELDMAAIKDYKPHCASCLAPITEEGWTCQCQNSLRKS